MASDMENGEIDILWWAKIHAMLLLLVVSKKNENRKNLNFLKCPALYLRFLKVYKLELCALLHL